MVMSVTPYRYSRLGGGVAEFLLQEEFDTADAAPVANPITCDPGPGTMTIVDTGNNLNITGGQAVISGVVGTGDPLLSDDVQRARVAGLVAICKAAITEKGYIGWDTDQAGAPMATGYYINITTLGIYDTSYYPVGAIVVGTTYTYAPILRTAGGFYLIKGGAFTDWTLAWVGYTNASANLYAAYAARSSGANLANLDYFRVAQLEAPWNTDYGIATNRLAGARAPGDTFVHEGDCLIDFVCTALPTGNQIELWFRMQDTSNYWAVTINAAGDIELDEVVATVVNQRGVSLAAIANGSRITITAVGNEIKVYDDGALLITYALASNFATETDGELDTEGTAGSVSDIVTWPRTLSVAALHELEKYSFD